MIKQMIVNKKLYYVGFQQKMKTYRNQNLLKVTEQQ